jgi:hypothetical protein
MYAGAITLAAPTARPPKIRQIVSSHAVKERPEPTALMKKTVAASTMTLMRPYRSASGPANQAPTALPSSAEETTNPRTRLDS